MRHPSIQQDPLAVWLSTMPIPSQWEAPSLPLSPSLDLWRYGIHDLSAARSALTEAERIIAAQEQRIKQLEALSTTDELTGLLNRRGFNTMLRQAIAHAKRDTQTAGVFVMCDLDGFKAINDTYGHAAGDGYLCAVATTLTNLVRETDSVARLGGDEFAILLPNSTTPDIAQRLHEIYRHFHEQDFNWDGHPLPLKASFGVTSYTGTSTADSVLIEADLQLYEAKRSRIRR